MSRKKDIRKVESVENQIVQKAEDSDEHAVDCGHTINART